MVTGDRVVMISSLGLWHMLTVRALRGIRGQGLGPQLLAWGF